MISLLVFLWFLRTTKASLFWLYLWQLKEYHSGRFIDHFRTEKGRSLLLNPLLLLKVVFVPVFFFLPLLVFFSLYIIYIAEGLKVLWDLVRKRILRPVLTLKTALLILLVVLVEIVFAFLLFSFGLKISDVTLAILVFDVLAPLVVTLIVFLLQPLVIFQRNRIIKRAKEKRDEFGDLLVIGITGSYGKTSTKEFLAVILSEKFKVLKTKEHQNSEVGISQCVLNDLKSDHQIFVVEMGAYNRGGIKLLSSIVKPKIGVLTGLNEQHLATFGSQENIIKAKYELIESLPANGVAFFNGNSKYCLDLYKKTRIKKVLFGKEASFPGQENMLGAVAVARELGMTEEEISRGKERVKDKFPGIEVKEGINGLNVIDATYSANPDGVLAHLEHLKTLSGKKVIIMPCLIELGEASKEIHQKIGKKIAEVCDLAIITTRDRFSDIQEGAGEKAIFIENPKKIFEKIKSFCQAEDIVLLESRVPEALIKKLIK